MNDPTRTAEQGGTTDPAYELLRLVTDALQDTRILAVVSWEGDHWYAEDAGLDALAILTKARDALEEAEEFLADPAVLARGGCRVISGAAPDGPADRKENT